MTALRCSRVPAPTLPIAAAVRRRCCCGLALSSTRIDRVRRRDDGSVAGQRVAEKRRASGISNCVHGLGIVAAVLGVVITMGALGGPPKEIGHKVAAALVGTFLGILLCYGMLSPIAVRINHEVEEQAHFYHVLRVAFTAFLKGSAR